jgi:hypothetical protein
VVTTVVGFKNPNGAVLAADSQVTFGKGRNFMAFNQYYKLNQLGDLPIVTGMWGSGSVSGLDIPSAMTDFWNTSMKGQRPKNWRVQELSAALLEYFKEMIGDRKDSLQMLVAGYSSDSPYPDLYEFSTNWEAVSDVATGQRSVIVWRGVTDAIRTLWWGYGPNLEQVMKRAGVEKEKREKVKSMMHDAWAWGPERMTFNMPIEAAAELCEFLVNLECTRQFYWPGTPQSSPPIDVAVVTIHGVKWMKRKPGARFLDSPQ